MSFNTIKVNNTDTDYTHSIFDISDYNSGAIYANLSAALAAVPQNKKQGGMTVKFIQQVTPARYSVVKTENLETLPTGTLLSEAPYIDSGTYDENQLSIVFSTLPSDTGAGNALTYYVAVTVDETTTYTSWVITKVLNSDNKYVQFRYMGTEITGTPNPFLDTTNWIDEDEIKSSNAPFVDLNIEDDNHNALVSFAEGHIRTKNFDSSKNAITTQQKEKLNSIEEGAQVNDVNVSPLNDLSDFSVSDPNGNTLLLLRNGHIRTKNFDSANSLKKSIKILFIGNSVTQDHVGYLPYLFKQLYPNEISFTIGNFYKAGRTIKDYVIDFITGNDTGLYSHAENTEIWTQDSQKYLLEAVTSEKWDIISIQAYTHRADAEDLSYAPTLVEWLRNNALSSFELAYLMPQNFVNASEKKDTRDAAITIIKENPCSILFAPYFCMEEAQKYWQVSGVLSPTGDGTHLREGLPVMITGMHLMDVICKRFGILSKIINNDLMMTRAIWATLNIPGPNGLVDESMNTEENYTKAQYCAVQGTKQTEAWFIKAINEMIASYN